MSRREFGLFAACLLTAAAAITIGAALISAPAGWITGGTLGGVWSWGVLTEARR